MSSDSPNFEESKHVSVMVVEDVDEMRELIEQVLTGTEGLILMKSARNGFEARLELNRRCPQVLLLDEILPGESSLDLLQEFVARGVSVILMTGLSDATHSLPSEAFSRISKPGWDSMKSDRERLKAEILKAAAQKTPVKAPS